jgi:hypothetical protein
MDETDYGTLKANGHIDAHGHANGHVSNGHIVAERSEVTPLNNSTKLVIESHRQSETHKSKPKDTDVVKQGILIEFTIFTTLGMSRDTSIF